MSTTIAISTSKGADFPLSNSTKVSFRIDQDDKERLEAVFKNIGLNISTGLAILTKGVIRRGGIPGEFFEDPFYGSANQSRLAASVRHDQEGHLIFKTTEELGLNDDE